MERKVVAVVFALAISVLVGCAYTPAARYAESNWRDHFHGRGHEEFDHRGERYQVTLDEPRNRMAISSMDNAIWSGTNGPKWDAPKVLYLRAAEAYLETKGSSCETKDIYRIIMTIWEVQLSCGDVVVR